MVTKMALLTQFLQTELLECQHRFFGHAEEMLHVSLTLLDFMIKGRFSIIVPDPVFWGGHSPPGTRV